MIRIFKEAGELNSRNTSYQFWKQDNEPKVIYTPEFAAQKLEYIHNNPVDAGIVEKAEEYIYSSARDYYYGKQCGLIKIEFYFYKELYVLSCKLRTAPIFYFDVLWTAGGLLPNIRKASPFRWIAAID